MLFNFFLLKTKTPNSPRYFQKDTYHHLYNRGANKKKVFIDKYDYEYFLKKMMEYKTKYDNELIAYCLMPNHFHIFIHQTTSEKLGSKFAGDLTNSYTKTLNKKYNRSGVLFESRNKNKIVYDKKAFPLVAKYILLNPVKAGLVDNFVKWEYSSSKELLGQVDSGLTDKIILEYFDTIQDFVEFIECDDGIDMTDIDKYIFK